jgi:hypothetical protein
MFCSAGPLDDSRVRRRTDPQPARGDRGSFHDITGDAVGAWFAAGFPRSCGRGVVAHHAL